MSSALDRHRALPVPLGGIIMLAVVLSLVGCGGSDSYDVRVLPTAVPAPELPGETLATAPAAQEMMAVVGLTGEQALGMHALPGYSQPVTREIPGTATDVLSLGQAHADEDGLSWFFVNWDGRQGWVPGGVAFVGQPIDETERSMSGLAPSGWSDPASLANAVAEQYVRAFAQVRVVDPATDAAGAATTTVDVVTPDDPGRVGTRLTVDSVEAADGWSVQAIQARPLCAFGFTNSGDCRQP